MENQDGGNASTAVEAQEQQLPETSEIQRLDNDTIRRITAEQAISDLPSIVKELIDNALDAESTTIKSKYFRENYRMMFLFNLHERGYFQSSFWLAQILFVVFRNAQTLFLSSFVWTGPGHYRGF